VLGYQLAQGTTPSAWIGWAGAAAIGMGFTGSLSLLCAGLALFGLAIVRCRVHPPLPGFLLIAGGVVLFMAQGFAPGFGKAHASPSPVWGALMGMALVAIAGAMADLDALHRGEASSEVPLGSGDAPPRRVR
jgi:hypothetical protein